MKVRLEGLLGSAVVGDPSGVLLQVTEVRKVEHHVAEGEIPEGWTMLADGLVATGPLKYAAGMVEVYMHPDAADAIAEALMAGAKLSREMAATAAAELAASTPPMLGNAALGPVVPPTMDDLLHGDG